MSEEEAFRAKLEEFIRESQAYYERSIKQLTELYVEKGGTIDLAQLREDLLLSAKALPTGRLTITVTTPGLQTPSAPRDQPVKGKFDGVYSIVGQSGGGTASDAVTANLLGLPLYVDVPYPEVYLGRITTHEGNPDWPLPPPYLTPAQKKVHRRFQGLKRRSIALVQIRRNGEAPPANLRLELKEGPAKADYDKKRRRLAFREPGIYVMEWVADNGIVGSEEHIGHIIDAHGKRHNYTRTSYRVNQPLRRPLGTFSVARVERLTCSPRRLYFIYGKNAPSPQSRELVVSAEGVTDKPFSTTPVASLEHDLEGNRGLFVVNGRTVQLVRQTPGSATLTLRPRIQGADMEAAVKLVAAEVSVDLVATDSPGRGAVVDYLEMPRSYTVRVTARGAAGSLDGVEAELAVVLADGGKLRLPRQPLGYTGGGSLWAAELPLTPESINYQPVDDAFTELMCFSQHHRPLHFSVTLTSEHDRTDPNGDRRALFSTHRTYPVRLPKLDAIMLEHQSGKGEEQGTYPFFIPSSPSTADQVTLACRLFFADGTEVGVDDPLMLKQIGAELHVTDRGGKRLDGAPFALESSTNSGMLRLRSSTFSAIRPDTYSVAMRLNRDDWRMFCKSDFSGADSHLTTQAVDIELNKLVLMQKPALDRKEQKIDYELYVFGRTPLSKYRVEWRAPGGGKRRSRLRKRGGLWTSRLSYPVVAGRIPLESVALKRGSKEVAGLWAGGSLAYTHIQKLTPQLFLGVPKTMALKGRIEVSATLTGIPEEYRPFTQLRWSVRDNAALAIADSTPPLLWSSQAGGMGTCETVIEVTDDALYKDIKQYVDVDVLMDLNAAMEQE